MTRAIQRVLVTGGNKGIGLATVAAILDHSASTAVILGSRNLQRGEAARAQLLAEHPDWQDRIELLPLDVADDQSVLEARAMLAKLFSDSPKPLFGLVNNAGIGLGAASLAAVLEVNLWGVRRVSDAMQDLLGDGGRIVNVTSAAGPNFVSSCSEQNRGRLTDAGASRAGLQALVEQALSLEGGAEAFDQAGLGDGSPYGFSKACANLLTLILARELPQLTVNACTPGFIETDLTRPLAVQQGKAAAELGMKPPADGTRAIIHLLLSAELPTGQYFGSDARRSPLDRYRAPGTPAYRAHS